MSLIKRRRNGTVQIYLRLTNKQYYLGTEENIDPDRVYNALSYLWDRTTTRHEKDIEYYERVGQMLENLLPKEGRRRLQETETIDETHGASLSLESFPQLAEAFVFRISKEELKSAKFTKEEIRKLEEAKEILDKIKRR